MRKVILCAACICIFSCGSLNPHQRNISWDANGDDRLNRYEFVNGYLNDHVFRSWTENDEPLLYNKFLQSVFKKMDMDDNGSIDEHEFDDRAALYSGQEGVLFREWDHDHDSQLTPSEFNAQGKIHIIPAWDVINDGNISDVEVARGMFDRCDLDNSGDVNVIELTIWFENRY